MFNSCILNTSSAFLQQHNKLISIISLKRNVINQVNMIVGVLKSSPRKKKDSNQCCQCSGASDKFHVYDGTDCYNDGTLWQFSFFVNVDDDDDYDNEGGGEVVVVVVTI